MKTYLYLHVDLDEKDFENTPHLSYFMEAVKPLIRKPVKLFQTCPDPPEKTIYLSFRGTSAADFTELVEFVQKMKYVSRIGLWIPVYKR